MDRKGIWTTYKGINFRSRLEATWAAFFDIVEWVWEYEPELPVPGYIPDFLLHGKEGREVYVEVKPLTIYVADRAGIVAKARAAIGQNADLLILTDTFEDSSVFPDCPVLGYMPCFDEISGEGDEQAILHCIGDYDLSHSWGSWEHRLSGLYSGDMYCNPVEKAEFYRLWSQARNQIQWKGPRS